MIKWTGTVAGCKIVGLGVTAGNVAKLRKGLPIWIKGQEIGLEFDILIHYGLDEKSLYRELKSGGLIDDDTIIHAVSSKGDRHE